MSVQELLLRRKKFRLNSRFKRLFETSNERLKNELRSIRR